MTHSRTRGATVVAFPSQRARRPAARGLLRRLPVHGSAGNVIDLASFRARSATASHHAPPPDAAA